MNRSEFREAHPADLAHRNRVGYTPQSMRTDVGEGGGRSSAGDPAHELRAEDAAGTCDGHQPGRLDDRGAVHVAVLEHHVAERDPDLGEAKPALQREHRAGLRVEDLRFVDASAAPRPTRRVWAARSGSPAAASAPASIRSGLAPTHR